MIDRGEGVREHYRAQGAVAERERIIALLETEHSEWTAQHQDNKRVYIDDCSACFAIALIKGDDK